MPMLSFYSYFGRGFLKIELCLFCLCLFLNKHVAYTMCILSNGFLPFIFTNYTMCPIDKRLFLCSMPGKKKRFNAPRVKKKKCYYCGTRGKSAPLTIQFF